MLQLLSSFKSVKTEESQSELEKYVIQHGIECQAVLTQKPKDEAIYVKQGQARQALSQKATLHARKGASWEDTAFHYSVTIAYKGKTFQTAFKCGLGHCIVRSSIWNGVQASLILPNAADVLNSLALDARACDMSFANWCQEYGYNTDSRQAFKTYEECQQNGDKLKSVFPANMIEEMRGCEH
jgi:hypothetical protein